MKKHLLATAVAALCASHVLHAQSITLNASTLKQSINLMGGDMERSAASLDNATNAQQIADWVFKDINFTVCRVSFDKKQELTEGAPNLAFYDKPISAMKKVQLARPAVKFWATLKSDYDGYGTENNLPDWIYTGAGYNGGTYDPTKLDVTKYAKFLADYLKHMHANGVPITYLSVSKEWQKVFDAEREKQTIDALKALLATTDFTGVPVPLFCGPASWGVVGGTTFINDVRAKGYGNRYHAFCTHEYDNPTEANWGSWVTAAGTKNKWNEESSTGANGPTNGAEVDITVPLSVYAKRCQWYRQGLQGELFFEQWSRGIAAETRSIYFTKGTDGVRYRGYYIMKHFGNHTANSSYLGSTRSSLTGVDTMAFRQGNKVTLWIINTSDTQFNNVPYTITGATLSSTTISRLAWSASTPAEGSASSFTRTNNTSFKNNIGPKAIIALTFNVN